MSRDQSTLSTVLGHFAAGSSRASGVVGGSPRTGPESRTGVRLSYSLLPNRDSIDADWEERIARAYVFDIAAAQGFLSGPKHLGNPILERLTSIVGVPDYFDAYCLTRGLSPEAVLDYASQFLEETEGDYRTRFGSLFGSGLLEMSDIQTRLAGTVTRQVENFEFDSTRAYVRQVIAGLGLEERIDTASDSAIGLTVNLPRPHDRCAQLFLAPARGLEAHRGALHALGHAIFSAMTRRSIDDLGVNIAATESVAFQAQQLALAEADQSQVEFLEFLHLFQARLYAARVIHEKVRVRSAERESKEIDSLGRAHLALRDLRPMAMRPKLVSVDFLLAFAEFYADPYPAVTWEDIKSKGSATTNAAIVGKLGVADPQVVLTDSGVA